MKRFICLILFGLLMIHTPLMAQEESLEDLLEQFEEIVIVSASKKAESLFDSPLSTSVVTRQDIEQSGVTSIPEALRLVPGMIVREQTPGNFDVHLRGFDHVPPGEPYFFAANTITLVMIDERVVYNYFSGGTFWETLPVDLHDIERIEVIRGPSAALYGPNAAAGVIHIITRKADAEKVTVRSNLAGGDPSTLLGRVAVDAPLNEKMQLTLSGHFNQRERHDTAYYDFFSQSYVEKPEDVRTFPRGGALGDIDVRYPDPDLALERLGLNAFLHYQMSDETELDVSAGYQDSRAQRIYVDLSATPLTTNDADSYYGDLRLKHKDFSGQLSFLSGTQDTRGLADWSFDFNTLDVITGYEYHLGDFLLQPGFSYRAAEYDGQAIGGAQTLTTTSPSLRTEYQRDRLRLIAALRADFYNHPDDTYLSYQFAATLKLSDNQLARAVVSRANRGSFFLDTYLNFILDVPTTYINFTGNKNLDLVTVDMAEIGFRHNMDDRLFVDLEGFVTRAQDYDNSQTVKMEFIDGRPHVYQQYVNLEVKAQQIGVTASVHYQMPGLNVRVFGTVQKTELKDFLPNSSKPDSLIDVDHEETPDFFGGMSLTYQPSPELTMNLSPYFYGEQTFYYTNNFVTEIESHVVLNARVDYKFYKQNSVYINARNVLADDTVEFAYGDRLLPTLIAGLNLKF